MARIAFMGSSEFACTAVRALAAAGHRIVCIYTRAPTGRRAKLTAMARLATERQYRLHCPATLKSDRERRMLAAFAPDIVVVAAYGLILPAEVLEIPRCGCLNIHASILPRWRGAAPIARAIMAGDRTTGVSIMRMDAGLDTGPVLGSAQVAIHSEDTRADLEAGLANVGAELIVPAVADVLTGKARFRDQPIHGVTYANKLRSGETRIDWSGTADDIRNHIHGLSPDPGAWCLTPDGRRLRVLSATVGVDGDTGAEPGCLIDASLEIACGRGSLRLERVQRAGGKSMDARAFENGARLIPGQRLP